MGIHLAIKHFRYFLEGRVFTVFTDHRPIVAALRKTSDPASGRQARQLAAIAEATSDVRHVSGKENVVADALSRTEAVENDAAQPDDLDEAPSFLCNAVHPGIDYRQLAADQEADPDVQAYRTAITSSWQTFLSRMVHSRCCATPQQVQQDLLYPKSGDD